MPNAIVEVDLELISDEPGFHTAFAAALGFPGYYGANMNAWIDCMTCLDDPSAEMTSVHVSEGNVLALQLKNVTSFKSRCPELYAAMLDCAAFVNWRRIEKGLEPVLCLSYYA